MTSFAVEKRFLPAQERGSKSESAPEKRSTRVSLVAPSQECRAKGQRQPEDTLRVSRFSSLRRDS
jgi:hypothetical protein